MVRDEHLSERLGERRELAELISIQSLLSELHSEISERVGVIRAMSEATKRQQRCRCPVTDEQKPEPG